MSVDMDVVGVMAAYLPVVCVCVLHSLERHCVCTAQSREALTMGKYDAITPTTSISKDTVEPLL